MKIILVALFTIKLVSAALPCDGISYDQASSSSSDVGSYYTYQIPAGVCRNFVGWSAQNGLRQYSEKWVCRSDGSDINWLNYETANCEGKPDTSQSYTNTILKDDSSVSNIEVTCCSNKQCDYGIKRSHQIVSCSDDTLISYGFIEESIYVMDSCAHSDKSHLGWYNVPSPAFVEMTCENDTISRLWHDVTDKSCTDTVVYDDSFDSGGCHTEWEYKTEAYNATNLILCGTTELVQCTTTTTPPNSNSDSNSDSNSTLLINTVFNTLIVVVIMSVMEAWLI